MTQYHVGDVVYVNSGRALITAVAIDGSPSEYLVLKEGVSGFNLADRLTDRDINGLASTGTPVLIPDTVAPSDLGGLTFPTVEPDASVSIPSFVPDLASLAPLLLIGLLVGGLK